MSVWVGVCLEPCQDKKKRAHEIDADEVERRLDSFMYSAGCPSNGTGVYRPDGMKNVVQLNKGESVKGSKIAGLTRERLFGVDARFESRGDYEML